MESETVAAEFHRIPAKCKLCAASFSTKKAALHHMFTKHRIRKKADAAKHLYLAAAAPFDP